MKNYGSKIKTFRNNKGLTQSQLANLLHVTPQAVSKWENNLSEPDLATFEKLAKVFDVSINDFLGEANEVSNKDNLGICSVCHKPYGFEGLLKTDEGLICYECTNKRELKEKQEAAKKLQEEKIIAAEKTSRKKQLIRFIIGAVLGLLLLAFWMFGALSTKPDAGTTTGELVVTALVLGLFSLTFVSQMLYKSWLREKFSEYVGRTFRMPGVIFDLSISGVVWLILVKLLFAIIGLILSIIVFLFGLVITFVISPVTYIIDLILFIRKKDLL